MDCVRTRAQERDSGSVLVFFDRRRSITACICAVSPGSGVHCRPGARAIGLHAKPVFHRRKWTAGLGPEVIFGAQRANTPDPSSRKNTEHSLTQPGLDFAGKHSCWNRGEIVFSVAMGGQFPGGVE